MTMAGVPTLELETPSQPVSGRPMALLIRLCFNSHIVPPFLQVGMNSSLPQFKEKERLVKKVGKLICSATNVIDQAEIEEESDLRGGWSSMSNYLPSVKAGGRVLETSFNCPHCPDHCEPFSDMRALNKHVKWDHELKHLLYEEEEEVTHQMAAKDDGRRVPHSKTAKDSVGNSSCGSSNSGTYLTAIEGED